MYVQRLRLSLLLFALVVTTGVTGYVWIEGWSYLDAAWMVFITVTTIGYGEVKPLSPAGRVFTMVFIISGLFIGSYAFSQATQYFMEGGFRRDFALRRRRALMAELKDHFIIAGYGRTGREIAMDLRHAGKKVIVVDPDERICAECEDDGFPTIVGDASNDDMLIQAGLERARGLAVATSSDAINIFITLTARQANANLKIMCRVDQEHAASKAMRAGADGVVSPHAIGGTNMANALLRPHSATFMAQAFARTHPDLSMEDVIIGKSSAYHDTLGSLHLRDEHRVMVVAIQKTDGTLIVAPGPNALLQEGDVIVVVGNPDDITRLHEAVDDDYVGQSMRS